VAEASGSPIAKLLLPRTAVARREGEPEEDKLDILRQTIGRRRRLLSPLRLLDHTIEPSAVTVRIGRGPVVVDLELGLEGC
jgi:hypothetical protein